MSGHTPVTVWPECNDHTNPDEDDRYECPMGKNSCLSYPSMTIPTPPFERWHRAEVLCETCTAFVKAMGEYEATHDSGSGADGFDMTICMAGEPDGIYCRQCTDENEDGEWVKCQLKS